MNTYEGLVQSTLKPPPPPQSPEYECDHGRLPGDPSPPCGCWPIEQPELKVAA